MTGADNTFCYWWKVVFALYVRYHVLPLVSSPPIFALFCTTGVGTCKHLSKPVLAVLNFLVQRVVSQWVLPTPQKVASWAVLPTAAVASLEGLTRTPRHSFPESFPGVPEDGFLFGIPTGLASWKLPVGSPGGSSVSNEVWLSALGIALLQIYSFVEYFVLALEVVAASSLCCSHTIYYSLTPL